MNCLKTGKILLEAVFLLTYKEKTPPINEYKNRQNVCFQGDLFIKITLQIKIFQVLYLNIV